MADAKERTLVVTETHRIAVPDGLEGVADLAAAYINTSNRLDTDGGGLWDYGELDTTYSAEVVLE